MYDGTPIRYDETGSPIGIQYRTSEYAPGTFDYFFFEKNLQGDIVAIYNANGTQRAGCESIHVFIGHVARIIVRPRISRVHRAVVLTNQLTEVIVMILVLNNPCGILDLRDVAVDVVHVSVRGGRDQPPAGG